VRIDNDVLRGGRPRAQLLLQLPKKGAEILDPFLVHLQQETVIWSAN
jgi:hypothetical protein